MEPSRDLEEGGPSVCLDYSADAQQHDRHYTANVYRGLRGFYGEIRVRGFQIYGDCMLPAFPAIFLKQKQQ